MNSKLHLISDQLSPDFLLQLAQGFQQIGLKSEKLAYETNYLLRYSATGAVIFSFAAELLLKGIKLVSNGTKIVGHDLLDLYNRLDRDVQKLIEISYNQKLLESEDADKPRVYQVVVSKNSTDNQIPYSRNTLEDFLKSHKDTFVNWRYLYEVGQDGFCHTVDFNSMRSFVGALIEIMNSYEWEGRFHRLD